MKRLNLVFNYFYIFSLFFKTPSYANIFKTVFVQTSALSLVLLVIQPLVWYHVHFLTAISFLKSEIDHAIQSSFQQDNFYSFSSVVFYLEPPNFDCPHENSNHIYPSLFVFFKLRPSGEIGELSTNEAVLSLVLSDILSKTCRPVSEIGSQISCCLNPALKTTGYSYHSGDLQIDFKLMRYYVMHCHLELLKNMLFDKPQLFWSSI